MTKKIYADHSATTKPREEVVTAMLKVLEEDFGNPSSIHRFGKIAKEHLEKSRENIASVINANVDQIFFTSGGTESDNLVVFGLANLLEKNTSKEKHIITSKIEHPAIKEPLEYLEKKGWKISWLNVDKEGFINIQELKSVITPKTLFVSIIHANNEVGTIQDIKTISSICKEYNALFHSDAIQSFGKIPINIKELDIDFLSVSSHKIYGPKGVGALYIKDKDKLAPVLIGGGQEKYLRPGTENLPGIVGFGTASRLINQDIYQNAVKLRSLQIKLVEGLSTLQESKEIIFTGTGLDKIKENIPIEKFLYRLPGHASICCKNMEGENLVLQADLRGIALSSGSACKSAERFEPSHVLVAMGTPSNYANGSLRISLGIENTNADVECIASSIHDIIKSLSKHTVLV
jgi:cysteine desulfurase